MALILRYFTEFGVGWPVEANASTQTVDTSVERLRLSLQLELSI